MSGVLLWQSSATGREYILPDYLTLNSGEPIARPERDQLIALLRFCIEGLEAQTERERYSITVPFVGLQPEAQR